MCTDCWYIMGPWAAHDPGSLGCFDATAHSIKKTNNKKNIYMKKKKHVYIKTRLRMFHLHNMGSAPGTQNSRATAPRPCRFAHP